MALSQQQSQQLYGTGSYVGWGEAEAAADAKAKGLTGGGGGGFEGEVDAAYNELGDYYNRLIDEAGGDINKALSRLQEDYDTGKRQRMASFNLTTQALSLAQDAFSSNAQEAYKTLQTRQLARGIGRQSAFDKSGALGIADTENADLTGNIDRGQAQLGLEKQGKQLAFDEANLMADTNLQRGTTDLNTNLSRFKTNAEDQRRKDAGNLALSRQSRAQQRFDAALL